MIEWIAAGMSCLTFIVSVALYVKVRRETR